MGRSERRGAGQWRSAGGYGALERQIESLHGEVLGGDGALLTDQQQRLGARAQRRAVAGQRAGGGGGGCGRCRVYRGAGRGRRVRVQASGRRTRYQRYQGARRRTAVRPR